MKKYFAIIVLVLGCISMNAQSNAKNEALKAANDIVYDLAHGKLEKFHWLTVEEVPRLFQNKSERNLEGWREVFENPNKMILPELQDVRKEGTSKGVDWNDVKVTDILYESYYDDDFGADEVKGYILIKSRGKLFNIFFKRGFLLNGEWRCLELRRIDVGNPE